MEAADKRMRGHNRTMRRLKHTPIAETPAAHEPDSIRRVSEDEIEPEYTESGEPEEEGELADALQELGRDSEPGRVSRHRSRAMDSGKCTECKLPVFVSRHRSYGEFRSRLG